MKLNYSNYNIVLEQVTNAIGNKISTDIDNIKNEQLKGMVERYIVTRNLSVEGLTSSDLVEYIYHDMNGLGFITRENLFEKDDFEELNVNAWNDIDIVFGGKTYKTDFSFSSPQRAIEIHEKMLRKTQVPFDNTMPRAIADIGDNIRICAERYPIVDKDVAVASSIRKVKSGFVTKDELLNWGTAADEMIEFLLLCLRYGASVCFSGETGSGKTTVSGALIAIVSQKLRTVTIEEGSREWQFKIKDEKKGGYKNSVVHLKTRPNDDEKLNITQETLVKDALRLDPSFLPIGEVRGDEAFEVIKACNTGHTVLTTTHSNGTEDTPSRLVTLAQKASGMSDNTLSVMVARAFPILVHIENCPDYVRRITEISEITGYNGVNFEQKTLYQFFVDDNIHDFDEGEEHVTLVNPRFEKCGTISDKLKQRMLKKGARLTDIERFGGGE